MNRTKLIAGALAIFLAATAAGCSKEDTKQDTPAQTTAVNNYEKKESDIVVTGEITSIIGNEVTLAIGEASDNTEGDASSEENSRPSFTDGERPSFADGEMPSFSDGEMPSFGDGEMPSFADGERPSFRERSEDTGNSGEGRRRRIRATVKKTGEEKSYIIPVGMPIKGLSSGKTDYSGLREGMVISLTINSDGVVCSAEVQ